MTLLWHLARFELRALRPILAVWAAALASQALVLRMGPPIPDGTAPPAMSLDVSAIVLRLAVTVLLAAALAHLHPLVGSTAFWRTRPIPRGLIFGSALGVLLLIAVALPAAWALAVFGWLGLDAASAARAATAIATEQLAVASFALLLASVSKNLAQVVVATVAGITLFSLGRMAAGGLPRAALPLAAPFAGSEFAEVFAIGAVVLTTLAIAGYQHLAMKTARTIAATIVLIAVAALGSRWFMVAVPARPAATTAREIVAPDLLIDRASIRTEHFTRLTRAGTQVGVRCTAVLIEAGEPGAVIQMPAGVRAVLEYDDGFVERFETAAPDLWAEADPRPARAAQPYASLAAALGGATFLESSDPVAGRFRVAFLEVRSDTFARRASQPARLDVDVDVEVYRYAVVARVPLRPGREARAEGHALAFEGTAPLDDGIELNLRETFLRIWRPVAPTYYVLRHTRSGEAILARVAREESFRTALIAHPAAALRRTVIEARAGRAVGDGATVLTPAWLEETELAVVRPERLGRATKTIRIDGFALVSDTRALPGS